jgi:DNA-binding transcriptional ArsR family regulator
MTQQRKAILEALEDLGQCQAATVADATGQPINHVREKLAELFNAGLVARIPRGTLVFFELTKPESRESSTSTTSKALQSAGLPGLDTTTL